MRYLKKLSTFLLILIIIGLAKSEVYAQPNPDFYGDAGSEVDGVFIITVKKIEISKDGNTWVTIGEGEKSFNIASREVGDSIGNYISNSSVPVGIYNYLRITQSRTLTIKGRSDNHEGNYYYTTTNVGQTTPEGFYKAGSVPVGSWDPNNPPSDYEAVPFQVPADAQGQPGETIEISGNDMTITKDLTNNPIVVSEGKNKTMVLAVHTQKMIGFEEVEGDYIFYPLPPRQDYSEE